MSESGEKSEEATPRQKEKARERGEVSQSKDLTGSVLLSVAALVLASQVEPAGSAIAGFARAVFASAGNSDWSTGSLLSVLGQGAMTAGLALLPLFAAILAVAIFVPFLQV